MSFNTALSGLRAANTDLEVTGNNIANASTTGFKRSRAEFGDVYANSLVAGSNTAGSGVLVNSISQQFDQGNVAFTDNSLDLAINGGGFFVLSEASGATSYTRAGYFGIDDEGYITNNSGSILQGFLPTGSGDSVGGTPADLQVQVADLPPQSTSTVDLLFNLDAREDVPPVVPFNPNDADTFNSSTSLTIFDSLGESHVLSTFYEKTPTQNVWNMHAYIADDAGVLQSVISPAGGAGGANDFFQLTFGTDGILTSSDPAVLNIDNWNPSGANQSSTSGATAGLSDYIVDIGTSTQFGSDFAVAAVDQNGFATGKLSGLEINPTGEVFARYTNGEALILGQVAMASFANTQGLNPLGKTSWAQSFESGEPVVGAPLTSTLGGIQSGALEESNVDLSEELVRLIIAQRNFQANAKTIETADTVTQAIINIR
ncbi:MAG: flagellar hook protein FlgE [Oceanicoccus sp.]